MLCILQTEKFMTNLRKDLLIILVIVFLVCSRKQAGKNPFLLNCMSNLIGVIKLFLICLNVKNMWKKFFLLQLK